MGLDRPYIGNNHLSEQGRRSGVGSRTDVFSGPATAFLGGLFGAAPDEQGGSVLDPNSAANSQRAALAGFGLGGLLQFAPLARALSTSKLGAFRRGSVKINDPQQLPQRAFSSDYQTAPVTDAAGHIATDIEGRPLLAEFIAGRRTLGGLDEGLSGDGANRVANSLGARVTPTSRSGKELGGDAGRYRRSDRSIFIDKALGPDALRGVLQHETGHLIDDIVAGTSGIPTNGLKNELAHLYDNLNNRFAGDPLSPRIPKKQHTPKADGYRPGEFDAELMAEAVRAYMQNPNYIKTVAPKTAARIREHVNGNPLLNRTVQFNSLGAGLLGADYFRSSD